MKRILEIAAGTIVGRDHALIAKNNQDAYYYLSNEKLTVAVVCDGCSSGKHSEVGAKIGARLLTNTIAQTAERFKEQIELPQFWERVRLDVLAQLRILANTMGESLSQTVIDHFLFTVIGAVITEKNTVIFSLGDGLIILNEEEIRLGPFPNNEPPYLAYDITGSPVIDRNPELVQLRINKIFPTEEIKTLLIGTDGTFDLMRVSKENMPGKDEEVGPISQFWEDDRYFNNSDMIRRKLSLINREVVKPNWKEKKMIKDVGLLPDDTTFVVIRHKE